MQLDWQNIKRVHFIGIGGISMSGLAKWLMRRGIHVSGSDARESKFTKELAHSGATITIGHDASAATGADLVVYTAAISRDNPELVAATKALIPCIHRPVLLGALMQSHRISVGISGTHGKTSTTGMLSTILIESGKDPSVHVGGELPMIGGTIRAGSGDIFVTEADEYAHSFLELRPNIAVVLNMEFDHPDIFPTFEDIQKAFVSFVSLLPMDGLLITCGDQPECVSLLEHCGRRGQTFGFGALCSFRAVDIAYNNQGCAHFTLLSPDAHPVSVELSVPGRHNILNALAAIAAAHACQVPIANAAALVSSFTGVKRRFELVGNTPKGTPVISDYAHHPTEVAALLQAAKAKTQGKVCLVFQPHTYSRTKALLAEYVEAMRAADQVYVTDIWAAREVDHGIVHARDLVDYAHDVAYVYRPDFTALAAELQDNCKPQDIILCAGAGDIERLCALLVESRHT